MQRAVQLNGGIVAVDPNRAPALAVGVCPRNLASLGPTKQPFWKHRALVVAGLRSNGDQRWGTHDVPLDGRISMVAQVGTHGPFALLTQADEPP